MAYTTGTEEDAVNGTAAVGQSAERASDDSIMDVANKNGEEFGGEAKT